MSLLKKKAPATATAKASAKKSAVSKSKGGVISDARMYDVIVRPLVTEKSTRAAEQNKVTFKIAKGASKADVKAAVEAIFKVTVTKVNTINVEGKMKKFRGRDGQRDDLRKAIVTLAAGQSIDFAAGAR